MRSQLVAQFMQFFGHRAYFDVLRQKVPYFDVLRQNRVVFNCFATKQCRGMLKMWGQPLFCNQPPKKVALSLSGSFWLTLAHSPALSGSLWLSLARCPALTGSLYGSLWLTLALPGSLWLSMALSGSLWLCIALQICLQSPCLAHKAPKQTFSALCAEKNGMHCAPKLAPHFILLCQEKS